MQLRVATLLPSIMSSAVPLVVYQHNELRDFTAEMMSEVCHNACIEPLLQPLSGEFFTHASATTEYEARLDISAQGFWGNCGIRGHFSMSGYLTQTPQHIRSYSYLQHIASMRERETT